MTDDHRTFIALLKKSGIYAVSQQYTDYLSILNSVDYNVLVDALLGGYYANPSFDSFSQIIEQVLLINDDDNLQENLVASLTERYISENFDNISQKADELYLELIFWDSMNLTGTEPYFTELSLAFADAAARDGLVSDELLDLMSTAELSPQLKHTRKLAADAVKKAIMSQISRAESAADKLDILLAYSTGGAGSRLVDDLIWNQSAESISQSIRNNNSLYFLLKDKLLNAKNSSISENPSLTLERMDNLESELDKSVDFGQNGDALKTLSFWRSRKFVGIPNSNLISMYSAAISQNPGYRDQLRKDISVMNGRKTDELNDLLYRPKQDNKTQRKPAQNPNNRQRASQSKRRSDGYSDRAPMNSGYDGGGGNNSKILYIVLGVFAVILIIAAGMILTKKGGNKDDDKTPETTQDTPSDATPTPKNNGENKTTPKPNSEKTPEPTPTPEPTKVPVPTDLPLDDDVIDDSDEVEVPIIDIEDEPINENEEFIIYE